MSNAKILEFKPKISTIDDENSVYSLRCRECGSANQKVSIAKKIGIWVECAECGFWSTLKDAEKMLVDAVAHIEYEP